MRTKQTIAIIGAGGTMGGALAKALAPGPDRLLLCGNATRTTALANALTGLCPEADVEAEACSENASWEADIIILAVPYHAEKELAEKIREVANQKIVISVSNAFNTAFDALLTQPGTSAAEELQALLPNSKVIKAFNTVFAATLDNPGVNGTRVDSFICGNDPEARGQVAELVRNTGLNPLIAGDLSMSRVTEGMALLLIRVANDHDSNAAAGWHVLRS